MYDDILSILYDKYYLHFTDYSPVTSSHWREIGSHNIIKGNDNWEVRGRGFGNFLENNLRNQIVHGPELLLSQRLLKQYQCHERIVRAGKRIANIQDRLCEFDCVKQMLSLAVITEHLQIDLSAQKSVL